LAHELDEFGVGGLALVETVFVLDKELLESAAPLSGEHLVDFALGNSVLVTTESMNKKAGFPTVL